MTGQREPDAADPKAGMAPPEPGPTPMRGVWVAVAILGGAAVVVFVLALTSGALG